MSTQTLKSALKKYQPQPSIVVDQDSGQSSFLVDSSSKKTLNALPEKNPYISKPQQLRALQLCDKFNDQKNKIQYLNLCKNVHPAIIDQAESFVADANADNKAALFMWKIKQIKLEWQKLDKDWHNPDRSATKKRPHRKTSETSLFD